MFYLQFKFYNIYVHLCTKSTKIYDKILMYDKSV